MNLKKLRGNIKDGTSRFFIFLFHTEEYPSSGVKEDHWRFLRRKSEGNGADYHVTMYHDAKTWTRMFMTICK